MSVKIDIDLRAGDAVGEITSIAGALETLDAAADDFDFDLDIDADKVSGEIGNIISELESLEVDSDRIAQNISESFAEIPDEIEIVHNHNTPSGSTGDGDSTGSDPPRPQRITVKGGDLPDFSEATADGGSAGSGMSKHQLAQKIEKVGGFDRGTVNVLGDFDAEELNRIASNIEHTTQDLTSGEYPHVSGIGDGNLGASQMPGNFADAEDPSDMDWNKLQRRASEAGVYTQDANRNTLEKRLRSQQFGGKTITVDTESHGTLGVRQALRKKQSAYDFSYGDKDDSDTSDGGKSEKGRMDKFRKVHENFGSRLRKLKPTMGKYMQLLAAMIPIAVALGTQLLGVAAAMGSVAAAGGAIMGLGLLGHGDSMAESMEQAKQEVQELKQELFQTLQPQMQQFAPIQSRMFDAIPEAFEENGIGEQLEELTAFEDTLFELGSALAGGMAEALKIINDNQEAISQLTTRFSGLIGSGLLNFFEWLIQAAKRNQELLIDVGRDMLKLAGVAYNLSMAVTRLIATLSPFFDVLLWISELMNGGILIGLIAMVAYLYALGKAALVIYTLGTAFSSLMSFISGASASMASYTLTTWGAVKATMALAAAIGAVSLGTALVVGAVTAGAAMSVGVGDNMPNNGGMGRGPGRRGTTIVHNDNRSFNITQQNGDYADRKAVGEEISKRNETKDAQSLPPVNSSAKNSDTRQQNR